MSVSLLPTVVLVDGVLGTSLVCSVAKYFVYYACVLPLSVGQLSSCPVVLFVCSLVFERALFLLATVW